jgi:NAD(P)-dependent dehydrogenase (short-subunit alcohol dehydrogenase family)
MNLGGKTVMITGSTDGVGRAVAERLAAGGAHVLVHGRNRERGESLVAAIAASGKGKATLYLADLASLAEVRRLAGEVLTDNPRIDVLINNAGAGFVPAGRQLTPDGLELRFAVNYLAGFLLTHLLLPTILASAPARIVNVSSIGQSPIDFDDAMMEKSWLGGRVAYTQSKLAQVMFTFDLAEELTGKNVTVTALHPATFMDTNMVRSAGVAPQSTVADGAEAIVALAADPRHAATTGVFYNGLNEARANEQAYDKAARTRLRDLSRKLAGLGG